MNAKPQSKSMLEGILETPSDKEMIEQGLLPESCAFHLETASTYTNIALQASTWEDCLKALRVVREQMDEIKEKIKKAQG